jgi:hypothetical protein
LANVEENGEKIHIPYSIRLKFNGFEPITIPLEDSIDSKTFCNMLNEKKKINLSAQILQPKVRKSEDAGNSVDTLSEIIIN